MFFKGRTAISLAFAGAIMLTATLSACQQRQPQSEVPTGGSVIRPSEWTKEQLRQDIVEMYNRYRDRYLGQSENGKHFFIRATGTGTNGAHAITISEAHGYGMMIFALMNGARGDERKIFDGMNRLRRVQKSVANPNLMSWVVFDVESDDPIAEIVDWTVPGGHWDRFGRSNSATDGDLDNAYALLLAYRVWGAQEYLDDAKAIIAAIKESQMGANSRRPKLGDWSASELNTRTSDWRPSHFRAFYNATGDRFWLEAADTVYALLAEVSHPITGLIPDFVTGQNPAFPDPTGGGVTGEHNKHHFAYNACRTPWFLALDYAHNATPEAKAQLNRIIAWLAEYSNKNIAKFASMRRLDGTRIRMDGSASDEILYNTVVFISPLASAMIANKDNQEFLNITYNALITGNPASAYNAYSAAIQLLNMILITGNWDAPHWALQR